MYFGDYIKTCRKRFHLTQQELVELLFDFHPVFHGLDTVTLSRWERNITSPNIERQRYFIEAMQPFDDTIFPAFDAIDMDAIENVMFTKGIQKVIGRHKTFILDFPTEIIETDAISMTDLRELDDPLPTLHIAHTFLKKVTDDYAQIPFERYSSWAIHPSSRFLLATYHKQFFGVLFSLRLKQEPFDALMTFQKEEKSITVEDLAPENEDGCEYPLTMLGYTEEVATLLSLRYYRHLISCQGKTGCAGTFPKRKEGEKLARTLGLERYQSNGTYHTYRANMVDVLLNRYILTILFRESNRA